MAATTGLGDFSICSNIFCPSWESLVTSSASLQDWIILKQMSIVLKRLQGIQSMAFLAIHSNIIRDLHADSVFCFTKHYFLLNVSSRNEASRLRGDEDGTSDSVVGPQLIHYFCHLILHLDWQCVDLGGEMTITKFRSQPTWPGSGNCYINHDCASHLGVWGVHPYNSNIALDFIVHMGSC